MGVVVEEPPEDPDDWTEEEWLAWLAAAPEDPEAGRAHPMSRSRHVGGGTLAAAMLGLDAAIFGERPKAEIVAVADADGLDLPDGELDGDDPAASWLVLPPEE